MGGMETCQWCGEEVGEARRCPSCGRIQYKYALDEGTNDAVAATTAKDDQTTAKDKEQSRIDDLYGREDILEEIVEVLGGKLPPEPTAPTPPPLRRTPPPPPVRANRVQRGTSARQGTTPTPVDQKRVAAGCFTSILLLGVGIFLFTSIASNGTSVGEFDAGRVFTILPVVLVVLLLRRRLRDRDR